MKSDLKKRCGNMNGFIWLRIGSSVGSSEHRNEVSVKDSQFLDHLIDSQFPEKVCAVWR
jgi:hypothetical protein